MVISELIEKLKTMQSEYGDVQVEVRNAAGSWSAAEEIQETYYGKFFDADPKWVVFIDGLAVAVSPSPTFEGKK